MKPNNQNKTKHTKNKKKRQSTNNYNTKQRRMEEERKTNRRERESERECDQRSSNVYKIITWLHLQFFQSFQCQGYLQSFSEIYFTSEKKNLSLNHHHHHDKIFTFLCTALAQLPIILEDQRHES